MLEQAFLQMGEVAIGVSRRSYPFVDLCQVHAIPRDLLFRQNTEHNPWGMSATDRHTKAPALSNCRSSLRGNDRGRLSSHRIGICKYFNLHEDVSNPD